MERKNIIYICLIVLVGAIMRFVLLTWNPPGLNWDEVSHGYNAYSLLKTGMDQWGQKFPILNFRAYGDYPTPLNLYLTIPFILVFGLNEFAIRFPHALIGTLTIISVYFLTFGITKKQNISLLASILVAIGPWYVFTSRFVLQSNLSVYLLITSAALFVNREKNKYLFPFSLLFFTLTLFAYHTTRIFSPLFIVGVMLIFRKEIKNKFIYLFVGLFIILSGYILVNPGALARGNVLFLIDQGAVNKIESARNNSLLPKFVNKIIYNRPVYFIEKFSRNYISYFSPKFLFLSGGTQYQFSVPNYGLIYPVNILFFYIGLILLVRNALNKSDNGSIKNYQLLLLWLILSPIAASLTNESFTVLRATTMLPLPEILIGLGFYYVLEKLPKISRLPASLLYAILIFVFAESYFVNYFTDYRKNYSWSWQYGYKEVVNYVQDNYDVYDKIIITKKYAEPHEYFLFYLRYDPLKYLSDRNKIAFNQSNWYWVDRFDKFYFVNDWQVKLNIPIISSIQNYFVTESKQTVDCSPSTVRCLLITSPDNFPPGWLKLKTVEFLDGKPAFEIYENN